MARWHESAQLRARGARGRARGPLRRVPRERTVVWPPRQMAESNRTGKRAWHRLLLAAVVGLAGWGLWARLTIPSDRTPEGAYLRVMIAVNRGHPQGFFAYLETRAQHACYTILDYKRKARERVVQAYPEPERTRMSRELAVFADLKDGPEVFAYLAGQRGWVARLRRDLSGVAHVEQDGERATVQTARGTRYPFRVRSENGIWGLTLFTADLVQEAERAARDYRMIDQAAIDYLRAQNQ